MAVVTSFGDVEPEDAWDAGDPLEVLVDNLRRRVDLLEHRATVPAVGPVVDELHHLGVRLAGVRQRRDRLDGRALVRLDAAAADLEALRARYVDEAGHGR